MRRGERNSIVASDRFGKAAIFKQALKSRKGELLARGLECFAQEQISRRVIGDSERIAVALVAHEELALVIGAPKIVGIVWARQCGAVSPRPSPAHVLHQTVPIDRS